MTQTLKKQQLYDGKKIMKARMGANLLYKPIEIYHFITKVTVPLTHPHFHFQLS